MVVQIVFVVFSLLENNNKCKKKPLTRCDKGDVFTMATLGCHRSQPASHRAPSCRCVASVASQAAAAATTTFSA